ncbi:uncharacterized protein [Gossypium hirsutum]|uniref:Retrotransposon gag domain-containing protein n=1 Tax=Gossypium hirsutum TaxID=3635 RepID=A0A1U8PMF8_GOSHI|nr:uncharacterized protein LOC107960530 [Gossypium hirsutum]
MNDIDCTPEQKLKGSVSLLRDERKYVGTGYVDARRREFMNLTQGDRSVVEYEAEFLRLSRYARGIVESKYEKRVHFEDDLRDSLRVLITPQREREFFILVDNAKVAEEPCEDCSRSQSGECWRRSEACLRCRSLERRIRECLQWVDQMHASRLGSIQPQRAVQQPPRGYKPAKGGNANTVFENPEISVESTSSDITALSPLGLDCATKRVILRTKDDKEMVVIGECQDYLSNIISALVVEKLVHKRCETYLTYVSVSISRNSSIEGIRTMRDFLDIFLEELPGLLPNREFEFGIELLPGTAPVSIVPYCIALNELTELKGQLQELLDHGFIRLSVSL